jgi:nitrite reductase/ring-hydroxylating ferredoxin subunit
MNVAWWPVALADALDAGQVLAVPLLGREHVLWRDAWGALHAHDDRCPHRGMRLSYGFVRDDRLTCPYHGWCFDGFGKCRALPAHPGARPAPTMRLREHRVHEADGLIWLQVSLEQADRTDAAWSVAPQAAGNGRIRGRNQPAAGWPEGLVAAPVRSQYLQTTPDTLHGALLQLDLEAPTACFEPGPPIGGTLLSSGERGLGWALQPVAKGRIGMHIVALTRDPVDTSWRKAVCRALRTLALPDPPCSDTDTTCL